jgi:hypothetical protein
VPQDLLLMRNLDKRGRWYVFQILCVVIGALCVWATWIPEKRWHAQEWLVPIWIVLTPLMVRASFLRPQPDSAVTRWGATQSVILGMLIVQVINVAFVFSGAMTWQNIAPIIILTAAVQVAAILVSRRRVARVRGD